VSGRSIGVILQLAAIVTKFAPTYIPYSKRVFNGLSGILVYSIFLIFLLFVTDVFVYRITTIICFIAVLTLMFYSLVNRSKRYIKSIEILGSSVEVLIADKDKELTLLNDDIENVRIRVVELFFGFNRVGRNYKLQIDTKRNGKFETVVEQFELGNWNLDLFKEVYGSYCTAKKIPFSLASLNRTLFRDKNKKQLTTCFAQAGEIC